MPFKLQARTNTEFDPRASYNCANPQLCHLIKVTVSFPELRPIYFPFTHPHSPHDPMTKPPENTFINPFVTPPNSLILHSS